jgi:uncharacterized membrane protein
MNLHTGQLPDALWWSGDTIAVVLLGWLVRRVRWTSLSPSQISGWLGASTLLAVLWQLSAGIRPGLDYHLLGASALCLIAGRDKALIGLAAVVLANCANGKGDFLAAGWSWLVGPLPAVWAADQMLRLSRRHLPPNYFGYFFANGFFGAALSFTLAACSLIAFHVATGLYTADYLVSEALPYYLLMSWSEAFTTGLVIAVLVIYRPQWIETFDDQYYLRGR